MSRPRIALLLLVLLTPGCGGPPPPRTLTLATTTSTRDSGLLDVLLPMFRQRTGIEVKVVAVGSGQALQLGRRGDADVILAHSPAAEERFMAEGHGLSRRAVMHNDFVLAGPPGDPAAIAGEHSIARAFHRIAQGPQRFVSRGDDSGTHQREREVWRDVGIEPEGDWYLRAGSGMSQTLRMADELGAYTLSDRGTFLALRDGLDLAVVSQGDPLLRNDYHVMVVRSAAHPEEAEAFAAFLVSPEARRAILTFGVERHGEPLFRPDADGS